MVGAHLHNGNLIRRLYRKQSEGHANVVIEVTLGISSAEFLRQHRGNQLFGGSLAISSRNADDRDIESLPMVGGQLLQGRQTVLHDYAARVFRQRSILGNDVGRALLQGTERELVTIETLAFEAYEDAVRDNVPRIGTDLRMFQISGVQFADFHRINVINVQTVSR